MAASEACPSCGVFFFKVLATPDSARSRVRERDTEPAGTYRSFRLGLVVVLTIAAGIGISIRLGGKGHDKVAAGPVAPAPAATNIPQSVVPAQRVPEILTAPAVQQVIEAPNAPNAPNAPKSPDDPKAAELERFLEKMPPFVRKLVTSADVMFDMQEETYRIANANKIPLEDVFFDGNEVRANVGDGSSFAAAAFAMTGMRGERRVCAIRVIRPSSDASYSPGAKASRWVTVNRRTTLAHELAHCVDWQSGGPDRPANLPRPPDNISAADQDRRWREEFADVHAMVLLKNAYGEDSAREAAAVRAFVRLDAPIWYSHARVPLSSPEVLRQSTPEETRAIVVRYWGS